MVAFQSKLHRPSKCRWISFRSPQVSTGKQLGPYLHSTLSLNISVIVFRYNAFYFILFGNIDNVISRKFHGLYYKGVSSRVCHKGVIVRDVCDSRCEEDEKSWMRGSNRCVVSGKIVRGAL